MPSLLNPVFRSLIQSLPVDDHSVFVHAAFWKAKFQNAQQLGLWEQIFRQRPTIRFSRKRLLNHRYETPEQKCAEILLWGYPSDSRGIISSLLNRLREISISASSDRPWKEYSDAFPKGTGVSTITKLAYFHRRTFGGHRALILDKRLIGNTKNWPEVHQPGLSYPSAKRRYLSYLDLLHNTAANPKLNCPPDQLEFFLFTLGDSF